MLRRFTVLLAGTAIAVSSITPVQAKTVEVPPLAFNAISAVAKEQDIEKGLQTALKDQNKAWFWELGGGIEKAMTANNEAEFTDMLNKNIAVVNTIYTLGMQYAEGKYSDMALTLADEAVGKLNNPAASAVWEMVKMTHQSYKAVADTKAALDIEMLYNVVNKDRRIVGKSRRGAPPTIVVNSKTVDYFFNKYLITNGSVRGMVKNYVEKSLGQQWPEQSWRDYMIGLAGGDSEAAQSESELRQLQSEEFRNVARIWIKSLLQDVNKQATVEYYRTRVRQEMAEYAKYAKKVGTYYANDYPVMWKILRAKKEAVAKLPEYKQALEDAKKVVKQAKKEKKSVKTEKQKRKFYGDWNTRLNTQSQALLNAGAGAFKADDMSLYNAIEREQSEIARLKQELAAYIEEVYDGEAELDPEFTDVQYDNMGFRMPSYLGTEVMLARYFAPLIMIYDVDESYVRSVIDDGVKLLNRGDFEGAKKLFEKRLGEGPDSVWASTYDQMALARKQMQEMCNEDPLSMSDPDLKAKASEQAQYMKKRQSNLSAEAMKQYYDEALNAYVGQWKQACNDGLTQLSAAHGITRKNIRALNARADEVEEAYAKMSATAHDQYKGLIALMADINNMTHPVDMLDAKETMGRSLVKAEGSGNWCKVNYPEKESGLLNIGGQFYNSALLTTGGGGGEEYFMKLESLVNKQIGQHEAAVQMWEGKQKLSSEDIKMIRVFVDGAEDIDTLIREMDKKVSLIPGFVSAERSDLNNFLAKARPSSRECDDVRERMSVYGDAFKKWQKEALASGYIKKSEGKLVPAKIKIDKTGMAYTDRPYPHYLTAAEISKASVKMRQFGLRGALVSALGQYPKASKEYRELIELKGIEPARADNIALYEVVYVDDVVEMSFQFENAKVGEESFLLLMDKAAKTFPDLVKKHAATYLIFIPKEDSLGAALESEIGKAYVTLAKTIKRRWDEHNAAVSKRMQEEWAEGATQKEKEMEEMFGSQEPIDADGYWVVDPRLNSRPYPSMGSSTILTRNDLISGKIYFGGRVNTLENVEKVLFSLDGGRTWNERPLASYVTFYLTPSEGKEYKPVVKLIRPEGFEPIILSLSNDTTVKYSNKGQAKKILNSIKTIAEAYERQNLALFTDLISSNFIGGRAALEEGVRYDFEMFTNIQLKIYINRITDAGNGKYVVNTRWDKTQIPRSTGAQQKSSGNTVITLIREEAGLKIQNLRGNLLYATLSPDIAAMSGLSATIVDEITTARDNRSTTQPGAGSSTGSSSGGSSSSAATLSVSSVTKNNYAPTFEFDFDNGISSTGGTPGPGYPPATTDIMFEGNGYFEGNTAIFADMTATNTFDNLNTAPDAGYGALPGGGSLFADVGKVYAFRTNQGKYGKIKILSASFAAGPNANVSFKYAIQSDGSKNIATQ